MNLRTKLTLVVLTLASVASLTVGALNHRATSQRLLAEVDRALADTVVGMPRDGRGRMELPMVRAPLSTYDVQVLDESGRVVRTTAEVPLPVGDEVASVLGQPSQSVLATVNGVGGDHRIISVGTRAGAFQVARPLDEVERVLGALRVRTAVTALVVAALAAALAWVVVGRATAPLRRVTAAADEIARTGGLDAAPDLEREAVGDDEAGRLAASFGKMLTTLRRSQDEQRRLVDDAGHELRTPLTSIRTNLEVLGRYRQLPEAERDEILADLRSETTELVGLVDELVTVARGASDEEPFVEVHLAELVAPLADRAMRRWGVPITLSADDSVVRGQPAALRRAVSNLLDNAGKFTASHLAVQSEAHPGTSSDGATSDDGIELVVRAGTIEVLDRGPGIAEVDLPLVFERFHRSVAARSMPGSGLGLAIVREVAVRHGGTVHARNRAGGGAAVGLELPLSPDS